LLFLLAEILLDGALEVLLADHRTSAVAFGLFLQIGAEAVQVEIAALGLGAVLYLLPVSLLVRPHDVEAGAGRTYQTSLHLSNMLPVAGSSSSLAASIWEIRSFLGGAGLGIGRLYGVRKSMSTASLKKLSSKPWDKMFSCGSR
jgi:hypothetical protein